VLAGDEIREPAAREDEHVGWPFWSARRVDAASAATRRGSIDHHDGAGGYARELDLRRGRCLTQERQGTLRPDLPERCRDRSAHLRARVRVPSGEKRAFDVARSHAPESNGRIAPSLRAAVVERSDQDADAFLPSLAHEAGDKLDEKRADRWCGDFQAGENPCVSRGADACDSPFGGLARGLITQEVQESVDIARARGKPGISNALREVGAR
jgi:hypothetical protein